MKFDYPLFDRKWPVTGSYAWHTKHNDGATDYGTWFGSNLYTPFEEQFVQYDSYPNIDGLGVRLIITMIELKDGKSTGNIVQYWHVSERFVNGKIVKGGVVIGKSGDSGSVGAHTHVVGKETGKRVNLTKEISRIMGLQENYQHERDRADGWKVKYYDLKNIEVKKLKQEIKELKSLVEKVNQEIKELKTLLAVEKLNCEKIEQTFENYKQMNKSTEKEGDELVEKPLEKDKPIDESNETAKPRYNLLRAIFKFLFRKND